MPSGKPISTARHRRSRGSPRRAVVGALAAVVAMCAAALALLSPGLAGAAGCTISWNGGSGSWNVASGWTSAATGGPALPNKSDDVCITAAGTYTVSLFGAVTVKSLTLGAGANSGTQTLWVNSPAGVPAAALTFVANSTVAVGGELELSGGAGGNTATLAGLAGASLTNDGQLLLAALAKGGEDLLRANVVNAAKATTEISTSNATQDQATTTTNDGTFTVDAGAALNLTNASGSFVNGGSVSNAGSVTLSGDASWTQNGPESGNTVTILNSGMLTDTSGAGFFTPTDSPTLIGTIPAGTDRHAERALRARRDDLAEQRHRQQRREPESGRPRRRRDADHRQRHDHQQRHDHHHERERERRRPGCHPR